jgi:hypothetical protein
MSSRRRRSRSVALAWTSAGARRALSRLRRAPRPPRDPDRAHGGPPGEAWPAQRSDRSGDAGDTGRDGPPPTAVLAAPAELAPPARVETRARLRRLRKLPGRLSERERVVLARVLASAALAEAGARPGRQPREAGRQRAHPSAPQGTQAPRPRGRRVAARPGAGAAGRSDVRGRLHAVRRARYGEAQLLVWKL